MVNSELSILTSWDQKHRPPSAASARYCNEKRLPSPFLTRQFPMSRIVAEVADARHVPDLFDCDMTIDATGEEALSLVLNEMHQERKVSGAATPPMLFAWVLGNGEVVQCLLSDGGNHAC